MTDQDVVYLRRAIRLAMAGRGFVEPNPMVGCVLVKDDRVIGQGIHAVWGGPHAEPTALAACTESPAGATAYVTLEPCCHTNKKTPPCAPRLIAAGIRRVVIGSVDPNPEVNGQGIAMLRGAGIEVCRVPEKIEAEANQLLAPFIKKMKFSRLYVTAKWAESADGFVAGPNGARVQISNAASSRLVHQLRARCDWIVVGVNTVLNDDPMLTARGVAGTRPLGRIVLDRRLRTPVTSKIVQTAREHATHIFCDPVTFQISPRVAELQALGVHVSPLYDDGSGAGFLDDPTVNTPHAAHVLIEPGPTLAHSVLPWVDRLWVIRSPKNLIAGDEAPRAPRVPDYYVMTGSRDAEGDTLSEYLNTRSNVFFTATPSADWIAGDETSTLSNTVSA